MLDEEIKKKLTEDFKNCRFIAGITFNKDSINSSSFSVGNTNANEMAMAIFQLRLLADNMEEKLISSAIYDVNTFTAHNNDGKLQS